MAFIDKFVAKFIQLEVTLFHAYSRLKADTDSKALHDLRIGVRRVRSLLTPFTVPPSDTLHAPSSG
jgi:CHAD domain-containing protein